MCAFKLRYVPLRLYSISPKTQYTPLQCKATDLQVDNAGLSLCHPFKRKFGLLSKIKLSSQGQNLSQMTAEE